MFGKKKKELPVGTRLMHYEGLPGFPADGPCFMEQTAEALIFRQVEGPAATLPLEKVTGLEIMEERHYAAKYRGTGLNTSKTNAVKWYAVFTYDTGKRLAFWFLEPKQMKVLQTLQKQVATATQDYTL